jgi:hypothetical protein
MSKHKDGAVRGQARKLSIKWLLTDKLQPGRRDGLEFWYSVGPEKDENVDVLVAVVDGYRWLNNPLQKWVRVKILPKDSAGLKKAAKSPDTVIQAARDGIKKFFETRPKGTRVSSEVRVWWNA